MRRYPVCVHVGVLAVMLCWAQKAQGGVTVRFDPVTAVVNLSDVVSFDIVADIGEPVVGWGLDVAFDNSIVSQVGSPAIGGSWLSVAAADGDGLAGLAFPASVSGPGVLLATVTFSADAVGETDLLAGVTLGDLTEGFPLDPVGFATVAFEAGHVTVIPEPATALLLSAAGVFGLRRRRGGEKRRKRVEKSKSEEVGGGRLKAPDCHLAAPLAGRGSGRREVESTRVVEGTVEGDCATGAASKLAG